MSQWHPEMLAGVRTPLSWAERTRARLLGVAKGDHKHQLSSAGEALSAGSPREQLGETRGHS